MEIDMNKWFEAAATGDIATIRAMIVAGVDLDQRDEQERTAFNIASQRKFTDIMTTILAARQMNYLKQIGLDPFAAPVAASVDERARTGTV
jgi:ankyrin repeat protein